MSVRRALALLLASASLVLGATGCSPIAEEDAATRCRADSENCVYVGVGEPLFIGALLSREEASGPDARAAMALAIDYLDSRFDGIDGTLLGHRIVVVDEEDTCESAADGRAAAEQMLAERRIVVAVGTTCSVSALGGADAAFDARKVPLLSPSNTAPSLTNARDHRRYYFRITFNDRIQSAVDATFAVEARQWTRGVSIADATNAYATELANAFGDGFRRAGGIIAPLTYTVDDQIPDLVANLVRRRPQIVFLPVFEPTCGELIQRIRAESTLDTTAILGSDACMTADTLVAAGTRTENLFGSGPDFTAARRSSFYSTTFLSAYRSLLGHDPTSPFHPAAFDATNLALHAIGTASTPLPGGALAIDRASIRSALLRIRGYPGLSGTLTCAASGDCLPRARIGIYQAPGWPIGNRPPRLVYSREESLLDLLTDR